MAPPGAGSSTMTSRSPRLTPLAHRLILLAITSALPSAIRAQNAAPASVRPAFESLRFREDWSRSPQGDAFDPLKRIEMGDDAWLSLGGHLRARAEHDDNFLGGGAGTRTDTFGLLRLHLHADLHAFTHGRLFVEGRMATARGRDLPGGIRSADRDDADLQNAFVEVGGVPMGGWTWTARVGRQELLAGRERVVSPLDWLNVRRTFQGAAIEGRGDAWSLSAFATHPVVVVPAGMNVPDVHTAFWGAQLAHAPRGQSRVTELFLLVKGTDAVGAVPAAQRTTIGVRHLGPVPDTRFSYELEGGAQLGATGGNTVAAFMVVSGVTATWTGDWAPTLGAGLDYASGTGAGAAAQTGTWDQLYPLAHAFLGFADVLARRNVIEERVVATATPAATLLLRASVHAFQRASTSDAAYDVTGAVLRASGASTAGDIGGEADLTAQWRIGRHLRVDGGVARFTPGTFMRETGAASPYTWVYASVTAMF